MPRTKVDAELEEAARAHESDPERREAIECSRRFKASWIELAAVLVRVRKTRAFERWGYESFEKYARTELRLRPETADKLTGSYSFLERKAPEVFSRDGVTSRFPSYQSVDFLRRAEETGHADREVMKDLRRKVLDEGASVASISKDYRDVLFPMSRGERHERERAMLRSLAERLVKELGSSRTVEKELAERVQRTLEALLEALPPDEQKAA